MAFEIGTAGDIADLLAKIRAFAQAQGWVDCNYTPGSDWVAKGPGDSGTEEIYINIGIVTDPANSKWNFTLRGAQGWYVGSNTLDGMYNCTNTVYSQLWDSPMKYWLLVNARRILFVAQVSTKYAIGHLGLITPLGLHSQYPYPMLTGGTHDDNVSWLDNTCSSFMLEYEYNSLILPDGDISDNIVTHTVKAEPWYQSCDITKPSPGNVYPILPHLLFNDRMSIGSVDGLFYVPGGNNSAENTITIGTDTFICFPSMAKTSEDEWFALKME